MEQKLKQICDLFCIEGTWAGWQEITVGNVNRTYKVDFCQEDGSTKAYMVQSLNTVAFHDPVAVMHNIDLVTGHIQAKRPGYDGLQFSHTGQGQPYHLEGDVCWRVFNYIPSVTHNACEDLEVVRSAGAAFGEFQQMLADFPTEKLYLTIPDFHNTKQRYRRLEADVAEDPLGLAETVREEVEWLLSVKEEVCVLCDLLQRGKLPLRVTHNDTKINNVLFDQTGKKALVVIDLDTVMPGLVGYDFGDAIRYAANRVEEDCPDCCRAGVDMAVFEAFADGFLSKTASMLTPAETETLARSCFVLACEQAVRFLNDYILGSPYFKTRYPEHNLTRTRCQIALARDMLAREAEMDEIIRNCAAKYRGNQN